MPSRKATSKKKTGWLCGDQGAEESAQAQWQGLSEVGRSCGRYPVVMIAPADSALLHEGSEVRRKWMDQVISQYDRPYLDRLIQYHHLVQQRNNLLRFFAENRTFDADQLTPWNEQMVPLAEAIAQQRAVFIGEFEPEFQTDPPRICAGQRDCGLELQSRVDLAISSRHCGGPSR